MVSETNLKRLFLRRIKQLMKCTYPSNSKVLNDKEKLNAFVKSKLRRVILRRKTHEFMFCLLPMKVPPKFIYQIDKFCNDFIYSSFFTQLFKKLVLKEDALITKQRSHDSTSLTENNKKISLSTASVEYSLQNLLLSAPKQFACEIQRINNCIEITKTVVYNQQSNQMKMRLFNEAVRLTSIAPSISIKKMFSALLNVDTLFGPIFDEVIEVNNENIVGWTSKYDLENNNTTTRQILPNCLNKKSSKEDIFSIAMENEISQDIDIINHNGANKNMDHHNLVCWNTQENSNNNNQICDVGYGILSCGKIMIANRIEGHVAVKALNAYFDKNDHKTLKIAMDLRNWIFSSNKWINGLLDSNYDTMRIKLINQNTFSLGNDRLFITKSPINTFELGLFFEKKEIINYVLTFYGRNSSLVRPNCVFELCRMALSFGEINDSIGLPHSLKQHFMKLLFQMH